MLKKKVGRGCLKMNQDVSKRSETWMFNHELKREQQEIFHITYVYPSITIRYNLKKKGRTSCQYA